MGWGGIITSLALRSHALSHIRHASTLLCVLMHFYTYVMLVRFCAFSCTFTDTSCYYASVRSHALHTYVMLVRSDALSLYVMLR